MYLQLTLESYLSSFNHQLNCETVCISAAMPVVIVITLVLPTGTTVAMPLTAQELVALLTSDILDVSNDELAEITQTELASLVNGIASNPIFSVGSDTTVRSHARTRTHATSNGARHENSHVS